MSSSEVPADDPTLASRIRGLPNALLTWHESLLTPVPDHRRTLGVMLLSTVCLMGLVGVPVFSHFLFSGDSGAFRSAPQELQLSALRLMTWVFGSLFFYGVLPAGFIHFVLKDSLRDYGFTLRGAAREIRTGLLLYAPLFPLIAVASRAPAFQHQYPFLRGPHSLPILLAWELLYGLQFLGLEFFFRGFMVHGTKRQLGIYSVLWMVPPYVLIHMAKPLPEMIGSGFLGLLLGALSLRSGSILTGVTLHLAIAWSMDLLALWPH